MKRKIKYLLDYTKKPHKSILKIWNNKNTLFFSYFDDKVFWIKYPFFVNLNKIPNRLKILIALIPIFTSSKGGVGIYRKKDLLVVDKADDKILEILEFVRYEMTKNYNYYKWGPRQTKIKIMAKDYENWGYSLEENVKNIYGVLYGGGKESVTTLALLNEILDDTIYLIWFKTPSKKESEYWEIKKNSIIGEKIVPIVIETNLRNSFLYMIGSAPLYYNIGINKLLYNAEFLEASYNEVNFTTTSTTFASSLGAQLWNYILNYMGINVKIGSIVHSITGSSCTYLLGTRYKKYAHLVESFHSNWRNMFEIMAFSYDKKLFGESIDWDHIAKRIVNNGLPEPLYAIGLFCNVFWAFENIKRYQNIEKYFDDKIICKKLYSIINGYNTSDFYFVNKSMKFAEKYLFPEIKNKITNILHSEFDVEILHPDDSDNIYYRRCTDTYFNKKIAKYIK